MEHKLAVKFIREGIDKSLKRWADLGAGTGTFTLALAEVLGGSHKIVAVDSDAIAMQSIPERSGSVSITKLIVDFSLHNFGPSDFDGFLVANALHFADDKLSLLKRLKHSLSPGGCMIVVEYDTAKASRWIPFPLNFASLTDLAARAGFSECRKLFSSKSAYGDWNIYSALLR